MQLCPANCPPAANHCHGPMHMRPQSPDAFPHAPSSGSPLPGRMQIAAKLEEEKARVEAEVLATARIVTSLESRLRNAQAAQEAASAQAAAALQQAADVSAHVHACVGS